MTKLNALDNALDALGQAQADIKRRERQLQERLQQNLTTSSAASCEPHQPNKAAVSRRKSQGQTGSGGR